jgi:hypothetical protein
MQTTNGYRWVDARAGLEKALDKMREIPPSREASIVITKIEEALMWLDRTDPDIEAKP